MDSGTLLFVGSTLLDSLPNFRLATFVRGIAQQEILPLPLSREIGVKVSLRGPRTSVRISQTVLVGRKFSRSDKWAIIAVSSFTDSQ